MGISTVHAVNFAFVWLIVALSVAGYVLTIKRIGERWVMWVVLAAGWALLAIPYTMLLAGISIGRTEMSVIWLCSFVLVMASLLLIFLKLMYVIRHRAKQ